MSESVIIKKSKLRSSAVVDQGEGVKTSLVLLFLIALIPLQNIYITKLPSLGGGLNLLNICFLIAFLVWKSRPELNIPTKTSLNKPIIFFILSLLFALVMRLVTLGSVSFEVVSHCKDVLLAPILFFIVLNSVRNRRGIMLALGASILPMIYMFRVFYAQHTSVSSYKYDDDMRISGTFSQLGSNEIATFYASYTIVLITLMYFIKDTKIRLVLGFISLLNLYSLVYSYSRGAYLGFLMGIVAILWHTKKKLIFLLIPVSFIFGGIAINFLPYSVQERVESIFVEDEAERDESATSRFVFWGIAMDQFYKNPVVGHGYQTFVEANPFHMDTHNYYLKLLAEQGIIGFIVFIVILWRAAKTGRSLYDESDDPLYKALGIGLFGVVASLAFGNIFGDRYTHYPLSAYFYVYTALALRALLLTREKNPLTTIIRKRT
jgi:O-antigen ligase